MPTLSSTATNARESGSSLFLTPRLRIFSLSSSFSLRRRPRVPYQEADSTCSLCGLDQCERRVREEREEERKNTTHSPACAEAIGSPLPGQSAQLRSAETSREVPTDPDLFSEQEREMEHSDEASHVSAGCAHANQGESVQATMQRIYGLISLFFRPPFAAQAFALAEGVLGDAHKRTRHGTAEPTTMPRRRFARRSPGQGPQPAWKRSTTRKLPHKTRRSDEEPLLRSGGAPLHAHYVEGSETRSGGAAHRASTWISNKTLYSIEEPLLLSQEDHPCAAQCAEGEKAARSKSCSERWTTTRAARRHDMKKEKSKPNSGEKSKPISRQRSKPISGHKSKEQREVPRSSRKKEREEHRAQQESDLLGLRGVGSHQQGESRHGWWRARRQGRRWMVARTLTSGGFAQTARRKCCERGGDERLQKIWN